MLIVRHATSRIQHTADADLALLFTTPTTAPFYEKIGWQAMPRAQFLVGSPTAATRHRDLAMMLFVSAKGRRHRARFEGASVYFGDDAW